ncbi:amino acid ABC transporter permease [Bifidobacterium subtile]|jgi:polar amino acid transport system permease protein/cystine transport system permease protein|uniref:Amino acid ABC transporter permease YckA1 n=1 Tax=Bifidobacterium subtile TaxID=77635 RepID=A0A087EAI5_9BIFI|nr:amino acid ABC transporter permease [Bifidobacterium subtile]KFJ04786.1 amino acid ABC transporter permease YckA1 [Bifidobacterium subtile]QOL35860.1 amino acid ABC transporter permease [Bifidobacterium subtile]
MLDTIVIPVLMGLPLTLLLSASAFLLGFIFGIPLALASVSNMPLLRGLARFLVWVERGVPPLVWLMMLYFGVRIGTLKLTSLQAGILGLTIVSMGYLSEIFRSGFQAIPHGQFEAASALGLGYTTRYRRVIFPQVISTMTPSLTTYFIGLLKDSTLASAIGVAEMAFQASLVSRQSSQAGVTPFFVAAVFYILVSVPIAVLTRSMEHRTPGGVNE